MSYLFLVIAFVSNGAANVLLKMGASRSGAYESLPALVAQQWPTLLGVGLFATNVVFYYLALRALSLSFAYPLMVGMSFLIASAAAVFLLREPFTWTLALGYAVILGGIVIVAQHA